MIIEEIIDFDKNNLTLEKLIYSKTGKFWVWYNRVQIVTSSLLFSPLIIIVFAKNSSILWFLICLPVICVILLLLRTLKFKVTPVLNEYNKKYNQNFKAGYFIFRDPKIISTIQYFVFIDYLKSNRITLSDKQLSKIIEALKYESSVPLYNYRTLTISITFLGILITTFLGSWVHDKNNTSELIKIAINSSLVLFMVSILFLGIEKFIFKDLIISKRLKYQRLIRVLENYSINLKSE